MTPEPVDPLPTLDPPPDGPPPGPDSPALDAQAMNRSPSNKEAPPPLTRKETEAEVKAETLRIPDEITPERKQEVVDAVWGVQEEGVGPK